MSFIGRVIVRPVSLLRFVYSVRIISWCYPYFVVLVFPVVFVFSVCECVASCDDVAVALRLVRVTFG